MSLFPEREAETFRSPGCVVQIWRPARAVMVTRVEGILTEKGAMSIEAGLWRQIAEDGGQLLGFHDWEEMSDYDLAARGRLTAAASRVIGQIEIAHFLLRSRVVAFGVQMANVLLKKLTVHQSRPEFERALHEAIQARTQRPR
jgi:hypothetical protein